MRRALSGVGLLCVLAACPGPSTGGQGGGGASGGGAGGGQGADAGPLDEVAVSVSLDAAVAAAPRDGFLYFGADIDAGTLAPLRPAFWRTSAYGTGEALAAFTGVGATVCYVLSDAWGQAHTTHPWDDWAVWESFVDQTVTAAKTQHVPITWWDVWNEPESTFGGSLDQLEEALRRATVVIRRDAPGAKVVGPSMASLSTQTFPVVLGMAARLADAGAPLDAISLHAFDAPADVEALLAQARASFTPDAGLCAHGCPQLHVNEYSSGQHDHLPGWALAWLGAFEVARADWVTKGCWNLPDGTSGCGRGLGGLRLPDGRPQPTYWVHEGWARLASRAVTEVGDVTVVAGVDRDGKVVVLVGRHGCGANRQWCTFADRAVDGRPGAAVRVTLAVGGLTATSLLAARIPRLAPQTALPTLETSTVAVDAGVVSLVVEDGEAWRLTAP